MTEMKERAISPRAETTDNKNSLTRLVLDIEGPNTAFTQRPHASGVLPVFVNGRYLLALLSLVAQTRTHEPLKDALAESGFDFDPIDPETVDPLTRTAIKYQTLLDNSLSAEEAAQVLSADIEGVTRRLVDRTLYGIPTKTGYKIPSFQFEDGELVRDLDKVLPLLHEELHPIAVQNWLTFPDPDLLIGGEPVSPRQWLLSGRDVADVARIALDL